MLRVSRLTDYATVVMTCIATHPHDVLSTGQIADETRLELPTVSKLLKALGHASLVESFRGVNGGYRLARSASEISLAEIVEALEGPIGMTECSLAEGHCDRESQCGVRGSWQQVNSVLDNALRSVSLADMLKTDAPDDRASRTPSPRRIVATTAPHRRYHVKTGRGYYRMNETMISDSSANTLRDNADVAEALGRSYAAGFVTEIEMTSLPPGLDEDIIRQLSAIKQEPEWMTDWRLAAYRHWLTMPTPDWAKLKISPIDYQALSYYAAPKAGPKSLDEVDPALLEAYEKLGVPLHERARLAGVAVDAVFDSVSVGTTFRKELAAAGVLFCSMSEAIREYPDIVKKYLGSVVPTGDNFFAALNSAVFSDGSFVFIPKGVRCPMELSTYFRINAQNTGQFERTLIVAEEGSHVSYLEGCTAPRRDENQLHAAVVELVALEKAQIKYSTVQNWYPGDENGKGGIYNFVTKRGDCRGDDAKISWTQVETGSAVTWKYPSVILRGDRSVGEFYSVALTHHHQQADTGTKMIHLGKYTKSKIVSKGISAGQSSNSYRGLVKMEKGAEGARNYTQCDSLLIGKKCGAHTFPYMEVKNPTAIVEHEATTSKISDDQMFYCRARGISAEDAVSMIVDGFCKQVFRELPMEFAVEAKKLLEVSLEGAVG